MRVEQSTGDVADRATILEIKVERLDREAARANARTELAAIREAWTSEDLPPMESLEDWGRLADVNRRLWDVEDALRVCEREGTFDARFVALARSVYRLNDERAALKRAINLALGSAIVEEKSYGGGGSDPK